MIRKIGDCILYHGDCLDILPSVGTVDAVITDLPYGTTKCAWDSVIPLPDMWAALSGTDKGNTAYVFTAQTPFDKVLGVSNLPMLRHEWIWEKGAATGFFNAKKMPLKAHENILIFYKKLPVYNPQITHGHERKTSSRMSVNSECYGKAIKKTNYNSTSRYPRSVQFFSSDKQKEKAHSTQKPVALMEYLVKTYTNPGDTVLDFTMGSGTTGVACVKNGRKFIGVEKDKTYFETACSRIERASQQVNLFYECVSKSSGERLNDDFNVRVKFNA